MKTSKSSKTQVAFTPPEHVMDISGPPPATLAANTQVENTSSLAGKAITLGVVLVLIGPLTGIFGGISYYLFTSTQELKDLVSDERVDLGRIGQSVSNVETALKEAKETNKGRSDALETALNGVTVQLKLLEGRLSEFQKK